MKLHDKNVLVTGGAGFIGSHLVDRIIQDQPANLVVVDNLFLGREENLQEAKSKFPELRVYRLDASDLSAMQDVAEKEKIDIVFNMAVVPLPTSLTYPFWTVETNIKITSIFCELARKGLIRTLVHCSSSETYGSAQFVPMKEDHPLRPETPYAASKAACDQIVMSYIYTFSIDAAVVRPFNTFGHRQNPGNYAGMIPIVMNRLKNNIPIEIFGDGLQTRDYVFVSDTVEAILRVYSNHATRGKIINIATGIETSVNELVRRLITLAGKPNHPVVHTDPRPGDVRRHQGDVLLLKQLTGFCPQPINDDQLCETIEWYQNAK